jgi:hypothetical protein
VRHVARLDDAFICCATSSRAEAPPGTRRARPYPELDSQASHSHRVRSGAPVGDKARPSAALSSADLFPTVAAAQNAVRDMPFFGAPTFDMQVCSQVDKTPSFSTIAALRLSPTVIERMRPVLRLWVMTPSLAGPAVMHAGSA